MNRLKELRKAKKLTQKELADKINVSKITVRSSRADSANAENDIRNRGVRKWKMNTLT